jgi:elongation factor 1-alpha
MHHEPLT